MSELKTAVEALRKKLDVKNQHQYNDFEMYNMALDDVLNLAALRQLEGQPQTVELSLKQREQIARDFVDAFPDAIAPTKFAYEQVCKANEEKRLRIAKLEAQPQAVSRDLMEALAADEHERWSGQARTALDEMTPERRERWDRLSKIPYSELSEEIKELDRMQVRERLAIMGTLATPAPQPASPIPSVDLDAVDGVVNDWSVLMDIGEEESEVLKESLHALLTARLKGAGA